MANIRIAELDFDTIKENLKNYLSSQDEFTDFDFEGSGLSVLLDVLAYNTHYNAYLANMLVNEMFLDSAVKRSSIVSIAKHLGYIPRSARGATALLDVTIVDPPNNPVSVTIDRFTPFSTTVNNNVYTFLTTQAYTITPKEGEYIFSSLPVKEGRLLEYSHVVVVPGPDEKYEIPNSSVDTTTLLVTVQNSSTDTTTTTYTLSSDTTDINGSSSVYFLEENPLGNYQLFFGDGILGKKLTTGNIIRIQYIASSGSGANVSGLISQSFTTNSVIGGTSNINILTVSNSSGGSEKETISSIKFNAPRYVSSKSRIVTKNDYAAIIRSTYPQIETVSVWGGEENVPPVYGKVYISLKPFTGFVIDEQIKADIKNTLLKDRQVLTVSPVIIDPDYIFINLIVDVNYNKNQTTLGVSQLSNLIRNAITNYFSTDLQQFEKPFYYSQLTQKINEVNNSILSSLLRIKIQKRIVPVLSTLNSYQEANTLKFNNKLHPGEFESTRFFILKDNVLRTVRMKDIPDTNPPDYNGTGTIVLYNVEDGTTISTIGAIQYSTGAVTLTGITPVGYPADQFEIILSSSAQEESFNVLAAKNQVILLDENSEQTSSSRLPGLTINLTAV